MKAHLVAVMIALLAAASSPAQTAAGRWFFSLDGLSDPNDVQSAAVTPANLATRVNPDGGVNGSRLYLWLNNPVSSRVWNGFQDYRIEIRGGDAVITEMAIYNINMIVDFNNDGPLPVIDPVYAPRWAYTAEVSGEGTQSVSGIAMFFVSGQIGIRNGSLPVGGDPHFRGTGANRATLVGHVDISPGSGSVFIRHGLASATTTAGVGISAANTFIRLGFGDESTVYTAAAGGDSPIPEATLTPEPAGFALLAAALLMAITRQSRTAVCSQRQSPVAAR
ncbi:hypothetical protein RAS1_41470 [Phycisphaerae bacterium RAS1]|nr:hypothetical protein RAS1_41470 [Phycisphaerae bacterium RAS1]